ncbi:MAG TPA: TlpA disulfide reductase family protein [Terriglobales bacterium]|nr:TlpA disulfide reductase family protein [Terriglobales bacterium]
MPALETGAAAPEFTLPGMDGKKFSLTEALKRGPVLAAFFKVSCPVCQFTLPFLERIHKACAGTKATVLGISQDDKKETAAFLREYGISFPVLLDDTRSYPVSNAYGLTNVPTVFLITSEGGIEISSVGWSRQDVESLAARLAQAAGKPPAAVFRPGEDVPDFKAG